MPGIYKSGSVRVSLLLSLIFLSALAIPVRAQLSTEDHLMEPGFWPTKRVASVDDFAGSAACSQCHRKIVASQLATSMAQTLSRATDSKPLQSASPLKFSQGKFHYEIQKLPRRVTYSTTDGSQKLTADLVWAFGTDRAAQSFLYKAPDGTVREAKVSYFSALQRLDVTPARSISQSDTLTEATERTVPAGEVRRCFACHSTRANIAGQFDEAKIVQGVACEACHGPGARHVAAMQANAAAGISSDAGEFIFNPGRLAAVDAVDFCGACHGASQDVKQSGATDVGVIRLQPYRLEMSKCWGLGDTRLRCASCHDPHQEVRTDAASYDAVCLSCHRSSAKQTADALHTEKPCPTANKNCTTCHMPKVEIPYMHKAFTDHKIQIANRPPA